MATLQQVADRAGVALSTVSFVLNKSSRVSDETREVVLKAVRELNYSLGRKGRPRRGTSEHRKNMVAFLIPFDTTLLRSSAVYLSSFEFAEAALTKANRGMITRSIRDSEPINVGWLKTKVDGALMILQDCMEAAALKIAPQLPLVRLMGRPMPGMPWDHVTYDNRLIGGIAARYLLDRGHRHCAALFPKMNEPHNTSGRVIQAERIQTFSETIQAAGGEVRVSDFEGDRRQQLIELFDSQPRPTGLFTNSDDFTQIAYGLLFSMGIRPGIDVDIVSCNNDEAIMCGLHPRPGTVDIHTAAIGSAGVCQLLERLESPALPHCVRLFEPTLVPAEYPWSASRIISHPPKKTWQK